MINLDRNDLVDWLEHVKIYANNGKVVDYIPALANQQPETNAVAFYPLGKENDVIHAGQADYYFTIQSISKVIALALALIQQGEQAVFSRVDKEPTSDPFYSVAKLEVEKPAKPFNPMINAGALAVTNMIRGRNSTDMVEEILTLIRLMANDESITFDHEVAQSEYETAFLNRALCYFMKQHGVITGSIEELLDVYTKQCAIQMNVKQLARIGAVFANDGKDPDTNEEIIPDQVARICKTFMVTCGMYNESGTFAINVGIPAKSGVSGAIMGVIKESGGIAVFGPALNDKGNSVVGIRFLEKLAEEKHWSIF
ncbi:glutaminase A [Tenuibacillus multivorans]|uniref:Glutaminase n=1 Tax=Tenuibacillus multivorans TaxID=237069 RepID=A0A1G9YAJ7_9BACI|nr:glutaminase A [Tenuibacillus multivorans]GEL76017.1 glutaminase 1 [Tenuibacillus multivorans]SDN06118.1 L-glutaminase [Tenuibacillus multivorans]